MAQNHRKCIEPRGLIANNRLHKGEREEDFDTGLSIHCSPTILTIVIRENGKNAKVSRKIKMRGLCARLA